MTATNGPVVVRVTSVEEGVWAGRKLYKDAEGIKEGDYLGGDERAFVLHGTIIEDGRVKPGDVVVAVPDPEIPNQWNFIPRR